MELKELLLEDIEREHDHLLDQEVGDEEYIATMKRLNILEDKLHEVKKLEADSEAKANQISLEREKFIHETETKAKQTQDEKKDKLIRNVLEGIKVGSGIIIPIIGLVWITATEKEVTFTGALKDYTKLFVPKKIT